MWKPGRILLSVSVIASLAGTLACQSSPAESKAVTAPPVHAPFDYQIGAPYQPPAGVRIVSRDHSASPAPGLYNICYVNAFQAQPHAERSWDADLLLRDGSGEVVIDTDWQEALLDLRTDDKRRRIAAKVDGWIDECADKGFDAVEPDNFDSYTRSDGLLSADDAQAYIKLLSAHAHDRHLAIGQKNTAELVSSAAANGVDFAVAEECAEHNECGDYASAFADKVVVIEYTDAGLAAACAGWGGRLSVVERDRNVTAPGSGEYVRRTC